MRKSCVVVLALFTMVGCQKAYNIDLQIPKSVAVDLNILPDSVTLNPSGFALLSARLNYNYAIAGSTKIIVFGKNGDASNIEHEFNDFGTEHSIPVIGLYANYKNSVAVILFDNNKDTIGRDTIYIQTGALPANMPAVISIDSADYSNLEPGINLVSNYSDLNSQKPYMMDNWGDIRWVLDYTTSPELGTLKFDDGIARLRNGNFFFGNISTNKIYEIDLYGNILKMWPLSGYLFHHEVMEKPNGNFLVSVTDTTSKHTDGSPTIEDFIIEIDRNTGNILNTWDLKQSLDEYRSVLYVSKDDWIHVNAIVYDSVDNTIIISGRVQGVIKLDYNNNVKWILSAHKGWGKNRRGEDMNQYLLSPLDRNGNLISDTAIINGSKNGDDFEWCWFQHSPLIMPNGDIMLFDDGTTRNFVKGPLYSRAVEYKIDEANKTVQQVWEYGKERGIETYSAIVSSVQFLPGTNHVLFAPGYQVINATGKGGKVVEVDYATRKAVFQASMSATNNWGFHRTKRISAYP